MIRTQMRSEKEAEVVSEGPCILIKDSKSYSLCKKGGILVDYRKVTGIIRLVALEDNFGH